MVPWATRRVSGWFRERKEKARLDEISRIGDALTDEEIVQVTAVCRPQSEHGVANEELRFDLAIVSVAPVAVRPHRLEAPACSLLVPQGVLAPNVRIEERPIAVEGDFLRTGGACKVPIRVPIRWNGDSPAFGMAASLGVSGELVVHGPWRSEYRRVKFGSVVFARVI